MKVTVTEDDIARGCRAHTLECPVARAVSRAAGMHALVTGRHICLLDDVPVGEDGWRDCKKHVIKEWDIPAEVADRILFFDRWFVMLPFEFEL